jgi:hypothetical protein
MTKILLHGGPEAHPDYRDVPSVDEEVKYVSEYVKNHLPGLSSPIQKKINLNVWEILVFNQG